MKKLFAMLLFCSGLYAQTDTEFSTLTVAVCETLSSTVGNDSIKVNTAFGTHLPQFFEKYAKSDEQASALYDKFFIRMQKNCPEFTRILSIGNLNEDWEILNQKPTTTINKAACRKFLDHKKMSYTEVGGEKTLVVLQKGIWSETFADGTTSRLNFKWKNDCEFELEFIESTNKDRKNLSTKGDKYQYGIFEETSKGLHVWVTNGEMYHTFWLYKN